MVALLASEMVACRTSDGWRLRRRRAMIFPSGREAVGRASRPPWRALLAEAGSPSTCSPYGLIYNSNSSSIGVPSGANSGIWGFNSLASLIAPLCVATRVIPKPLYRRMAAVFSFVVTSQRRLHPRAAASSRAALRSAVATPARRTSD